MINIGPQLMQKYRANSSKPGIAQTKTRMCKGPCKRCRSVAQFAAGDTLCRICRNRA